MKNNKICGKLREGANFGGRKKQWWQAKYIFGLGQCPD